MAAGRFDRRFLHSAFGLAAGTVLAWGGFPLLARFFGAEPAAGPFGLLVWPAVLVLAMSGAVALARLLARAFDPLRDAESRFQRINQRVLSNTVEQAAVFCPALLAAAALGGETVAAALAPATLLFVSGRILFWLGYLIDPLYRATGMVVTLWVNAGLVGYAGWRLLG